MRSLDLTYDADEDVLEVTFGLDGDQDARTVPLNDNALLFTDLGLREVWGLTFYSFSRLLDVSETELTSLRDLTDAQQGLVLGLLSREPASLFLDITYPEALIARVNAPNLRNLILAGE